jgi:N-acetylglucosaminyl-diphospho-decaprenol L-rhamnosyltransferase
MKKNIKKYEVSISIVIHNQTELVSELLSDLNCVNSNKFEVILTCNTTNDELPLATYKYPIKIIRNRAPKGFGANHNAAAMASEGTFFAVVNPDIRLSSFSFQALLNVFDDHLVGAVAPVVVSSDGNIEDSVRRFPTFKRLFIRTVLRQRIPDYTLKAQPISVDWAAGMFLLFRTKIFREIGGFDDEKFFMYMEDVDICRRLHRLGFLVKAQPLAVVVHNAQRASRRNFQHMRWHVVSVFRYFSER